MFATTFVPAMMRLYVLVSVLFGVTCGSYPDVAGCGSRDPDNGLLLCHCDAQCEIYSDCCLEYARNSTESLQTGNIKVELMETCESVPGLDYNIYVVSKLNTRSARYMPILNACQTPNSLDAMQALPIYDERLQINFKNVPCYALFLFLNDMYISLEDSLENVTQRWALQVPAECFYRMEADLADRDYSALVAMALAGKYCRVTTVPPGGSNTRICFQPPDPDVCVNGEACNSYQSPVMDDVGEMFKNGDCAACARRPMRSIGREESRSDADEVTLFTLRRTAISNFAIDERICWSKEKTPCTQDEMVSCDICVEPIESVHGFLFGAELVVKSDRTLNIDYTDSLAFDRTLIPLAANVIEMNMKFRIDLVRNAGTCIHHIRIALYLKESVGYTEYRRLLSGVNETFKATREGLEREIGKVFLNGTVDCGVGVDTGSVLGVVNVPPNLDSIDQRLVIFGAVFGFIVLTVVFVIVIKTITTRLSIRQNAASADTGNAEDGGN